MFNFLWINFNWIQTNKHHLTCNSQNLASWSKKFSFILVKAWKEKIFQVFEFTIIIVFEKKTWYFMNQWLHSVRSYWKDLTWLLHYVCIKTTVYVLALFNLGHITSSRAQICHFTHTSLLNYLYVTIFIYLSLQIMQFL